MGIMPEQGKVRKTLAKARFDIAVQIVRCAWVLRREIVERNSFIRSNECFMESGTC